VGDRAEDLSPLFWRGSLQAPGSGKGERLGKLDSPHSHPPVEDRSGSTATGRWMGMGVVVFVLQPLVAPSMGMGRAQFPYPLTRPSGGNSAEIFAIISAEFPAINWPTSHASAGSATSMELHLVVRKAQFVTGSRRLRRSS